VLLTFVLVTPHQASSWWHNLFTFPVMDPRPAGGRRWGAVTGRDAVVVSSGTRFFAASGRCRVGGVWCGMYVLCMSCRPIGILAMLCPRFSSMVPFSAIRQTRGMNLGDDPQIAGRALAHHHLHGHGRGLPTYLGDRLLSRCWMQPYAHAGTRAE
jgi:hypothetical protein